MKQTVEERLSTLEKLVQTMQESDTLSIKQHLMDKAEIMAIYSLVQDLAEQAGVPSDLFVRHYQIRFHWWHDYKMREVEDIDPAIAAKLDVRLPEHISTERYYPFLFDPLPPEDS